MANTGDTGHTEVGVDRRWTTDADPNRELHDRLVQALVRASRLNLSRDDLLLLCFSTGIGIEEVRHAMGR